MTFIDTNILVHAVSPLSPEHGRAVAALHSLQAQWEPWISRQVLREYVSVVTRPQQWAEPVPLARAVTDATTFMSAFNLVDDGSHVWSRFEVLCREHQFGGKQVHDAYLAATILAYGGSRLLTFNARHFRRFAPSIEIVEP